MSTEESLREGFARLCTAAGISAPDLVVDDDRKPGLSPANVRRGDGDYRVVVSPALLDAPPAEQTWHLASALGWWASPVPRRRRRQGWGVSLAVLVPHLVIGGAALFDDTGVPRWAAFVAGPMLGFFLIPLTAALGRWDQRALDEAGRSVLATAGYDPATLTRIVFGGRPDPAWWRRPTSPEPMPSRRIAAAQRWRTRPAPSLH